MASEQEMMADLAAADSAGDTQLAQHIADQIKAARTPMSMGDRLRNAAHGGAGLLPMAGAILGGATGATAGSALGPLGTVGGGAVGAGLLSAAGKSAQHAIDSALGYEQPDIEASTKDSLQTGAKDAALTGIGEMAAPVVAKVAGAVSGKLGEVAKGAEGKIADWNAKPLEATARSARGTAGAAHANASRAVERLGMTEALPVSEQAANQAALGTPEAEQLATGLAQKARAELPGKLGQMQNADALAAQAEADAQAARTPQAVAEAAQRMRGETTKRLLTRYVIPAGGGAAASALLGHDPATGAAIGLLGRPSYRAILRALTSPGFVAPASRAAQGAVEPLASLGAESAAPFVAGGASAVEESGAPARLQALLADLRKKRDQNQSQYLGANP